MILPRLKIALILILCLSLAVSIFYWNEARKELWFLCGNFTKGVPEQSVRRQLDTGHFIRYRTEPSPSGRRIIAESTYPLAWYTCTIDIDAGGNVAGAGP